MVTTACFTTPRHTPVAVQTRGHIVENVHYGTVVATGADGALIGAAGDPAATFFARSALKPLQVLAMVRHGLDLRGELLALSASSHSGQPAHISGIRRMLKHHGISERSLRNAADLPYDDSERTYWLRSSKTAKQVAHGCSGKHAAMLVTCSLNGWPMANYLDISHPLQQAIRATIEHTTGEPVRGESLDGCGAPVFATSLTGIARAYGALTSAPPRSAETSIADAMRTHPGAVAGERRTVTAAMRALPGALVKDGADGILAVGMPDGRGIAVKISDGSQRAPMPVAIRALQYLATSNVDVDALAVLPVPGGHQTVGTLRALNFLPGVVNPA